MENRIKSRWWVNRRYLLLALSEIKQNQGDVFVKGGGLTKNDEEGLSFQSVSGKVLSYMFNVVRKKQIIS